MIVLGINAYHGDASAALFRDGQLLAAVEEERFTRVKHAAGFPSSCRQVVPRVERSGRGGDRPRRDRAQALRAHHPQGAVGAAAPASGPRAARGRGNGSATSETSVAHAARRPDGRSRRGAALRRTPRRARGQLLLLVPVRGCRGTLAGRSGRLFQHALGLRPRYGPGRRGLRLLPPLPRLLLLGDYAVPGHVEVR